MASNPSVSSVTMSSNSMSTSGSTANLLGVQNPNNSSIVNLINSQLANNQINTPAPSSSLKLSDDNNPFDVTENRDYFKSQDMEIKQLIINNSMELRNLWVQIYHTSDGLVFQTRSINKFKKINNCITGNELVEWLIKKKSVSK